MSVHDSGFSADHIPLAYLITFRCYGTWLHGDERGSVDRYHNRHGEPLIAPNERLRWQNARALRYSPIELDAERRAAVEAAIRETCEIRGWQLHAMNVRTNHVHTVVTADSLPEPVLSAFKANSTRQMRKSGCWQGSDSPWSERGSKRYLWTERSVDRAMDYVINGQGDQLPDFNADGND